MFMKFGWGCAWHRPAACKTNISNNPGRSNPHAVAKHNLFRKEAKHRNQSNFSIPLDDEHAFKHAESNVNSLCLMAALGANRARTHRQSHNPLIVGTMRSLKTSRAEYHIPYTAYNIRYHIIYNIQYTTYNIRGKRRNLPTSDIQYTWKAEKSSHIPHRIPYTIYDIQYTWKAEKSSHIRARNAFCTAEEGLSIKARRPG